MINERGFFPQRVEKFMTRMINSDTSTLIVCLLRWSHYLCMASKGAMERKRRKTSRMMD